MRLLPLLWEFVLLFQQIMGYLTVCELVFLDGENLDDEHLDSQRLDLFHTLI